MVRKLFKRHHGMTQNDAIDEVGAFITMLNNLGDMNLGYEPGMRRDAHAITMRLTQNGLTYLSNVP